MLWSRFWCQTSVLLARTQERLVLSWQSLEQDYLCLIVMLGSNSWSLEHCRASEAVTVSALFTAGSYVSNVQPNLEEKWVGFAAEEWFSTVVSEVEPQTAVRRSHLGLCVVTEGLRRKSVVPEGQTQGGWLKCHAADPLPAAQTLLCASWVRKCFIYLFLHLSVSLFPGAG